ncbi:hypothetical protein BgiMline_025236, partial [Biomphalaria glabrata]
LCYEDQVTCVRTMRQVLVNTSYYWFGTSHNETCQGSSSMSCDNPEPIRLSLASRLFGLSDVHNKTELTALTRQVKLAFVTFNSPAGSIFACGHNFKIPEVANYIVDPLRTMAISSWSLQKVPQVAWDSPNNQTLYTVVIWDAGHYHLHGLYINCYQSSLISGTTIFNYSAPSNPYYISNPVVVLVIPQTVRLNQSSVAQAVEAITGRHQGRFVLSEFRDQFSQELSQRPSHINIITLEADPFAVQYYRDKFVVDNCALLISRLTPLHQVAKLSNLSMSWGDNSTESTDFNNTYLTSLALNVAVTYNTGDFRVEYCCTNYSITSGMFTANPFDESPVRSAVVRLRPRVTLSPMNMKDANRYRSRVYTLFMVDVAPAVEAGQSNARYFTHWLVTNIRNGDISSGDELSEYFGPNPIIPNAPRTYMFLLFHQPVERLNNSVIDHFCPNGRWICQIQLTPVLQAWNLTELVGVTWFRAVNDGFAKMRTYTVLKMMSMEEVCANVTGYPGSCHTSRPTDQTSTINNNNSASANINNNGCTIHTALQMMTATLVMVLLLGL